VNNLDAYYFAARVEHDLKLSRAHMLSHLGASIAPEIQRRPASQPRRRQGWLTRFARPAAS
jgi:hypothetical protein